MANRMTLAQAIQERGNRDVPVNKPYYNKLGDFLSVHFENVPAESVRVDEFLTIYVAMHDNEQIVGCKIKGAAMLARNVLRMGGGHEGLVEVRWLLTSAGGPTPGKFYFDVSERANAASVRIDDFELLGS